jgi:hypothetical protein
MRRRSSINHINHLPEVSPLKAFGGAAASLAVEHVEPASSVFTMSRSASSSATRRGESFSGQPAHLLHRARSWASRRRQESSRRPELSLERLARAMTARGLVGDQNRLLDRLLKRSGLFDVAARAARARWALPRLVDDTRHQACAITGSLSVIRAVRPSATMNPPPKLRDRPNEAGRRLRRDVHREEVQRAL